MKLYLTLLNWVIIGVLAIELLPVRPVVLLICNFVWN